MQILQLSTAVPRNKYSTEELMQIFPTEIPEGVRQNILNLGVSKRYLVNHSDSPMKSETILSETALLDLCSAACERALEKASLSIKDVGYFIATYDVNPFLCPGLSQLLIRKIGFSPYIKHVNIQGMACSAFSNALEVAENYLAAYPDDFVLLCISGANSYWFYNQVHGFRDIIEINQINLIKDKDKRQMELRKWIAVMEFFLFGDGVASVVVKRDGDGLGVSRIVEVTNLKSRDYLAGYARLAALNEPFKFGFCSHLDKEIPKLGLKYAAKCVDRLLGKNAEDTMKAAKKWAVHTGSEKILNIIAKHYQIPRKKLRESYSVLRDYGNLAGASLPFILEKIVSENEFSKGGIILALGYGWGFSASAALLEYKE